MGFSIKEMIDRSHSIAVGVIDVANQIKLYLFKFGGLTIFRLMICVFSIDSIVYWSEVDKSILQMILWTWAEHA